MRSGSRPAATSSTGTSAPARSRPKPMRAVRLDAVGPPENLKVVERPIPSVGDDDILIKVEYAGLIYADAEARRGTYYSTTILPWYPGREVAGRVHAVGKNVRGIKPGER